jgi:hypothetical protein
MPLSLSNIFLANDHAARFVKPRAIDQAGLKRLQLLAGNDVIMDVDDHETILLRKFSLYLAENRAPEQAGLE